MGTRSTIDDKIREETYAIGTLDESSVGSTLHIRLYPHTFGVLESIVEKIVD